MVARADGGASSRTRYLRSLRTPFQVMTGARRLAGLEALKVVAVFPAVLMFLAAGIFGNALLLPLALLYLIGASPVAYVVGGLVGGHVSRFAYLYRSRTLMAQGALFGAAFTPAIGTLFMNDAPVRAFAAWVGAFALVGGFAGFAGARAITRWSGI